MVDTIVFVETRKSNNTTMLSLCVCMRRGAGLQENSGKSYLTDKVEKLVGCRKLTFKVEAPPPTYMGWRR